MRQALNDQFISGYAGLEETRLNLQDGLYDSLERGDLPALIAAIKRLFAAIPWRNFTGNDLLEAEGYYASVLYAFFASLNAEIIPEDISNQGQVDLTVKLAGFTYVMEIKLDRAAAPAEAETSERTGAESNPALDQIRARGYSAKYRGAPSRGLFEVGLVFGSAARNLPQAHWRRVEG